MTGGEKTGNKTGKQEIKFKKKQEENRKNRKNLEKTGKKQEENRKSEKMPFF